MSQKTKTILGLAAFAGLLVGAVLAYNALSKRVPPDADPPRTQAQGEQSSQANQSSQNAAPDFTVTDEAGSAVRLSDFRGKPVVLNFWASWCPPCRKEMPDFDKAHRELGGEVMFMMVNCGDDAPDGMRFVQDLGYGFPVYFDTQDEGTTAYGVTGIPATFFINAEGSIVSNKVGSLSEAALRAGIEGIRG